ncbi:MAG: ABC transporter permease, partial [Methylobacterium sp.]
MLRFILRRIAYMVPTLFAVSIVAFVIIQLPPGDYLTTLMADWASGGGAVEMGTVEVLRERYGLDQPIWIQYFYWISGIVTRGDFGISFELNRPVTDVIWGRLGYTFLISFCTLLFIWALALPIGIYSAVKQYSIGDYVATFFGFLGLAIPNFLLALVLMYVTVSYFGASVGGLFSPAMVDAPWGLAKFADFLAHVWLPILVVGTAGLASL